MKDLNHLFLWIKNYFANGFRIRTILVFPHYPSRGSTIYKVGKILNANITNNLNANFDIGLYWEYATHRVEFEELERISENKQILNIQSRDISKIYVDNVFKKVFGYSTFIDPLTFKGNMVQKSDVNALHDGKIITGPISEKLENVVYQLVIDNSYGDDLVLDIRVPIIDETLSFVYLKYRKISERFKNTTVNSDVVPIGSVLTADEIILLNKYVFELNLNYGELDVLRNKDDGRIYIVDVNNTPQGPPANTAKEEGIRALTEISKTLKSNYFPK